MPQPQILRNQIESSRTPIHRQPVEGPVRSGRVVGQLAIAEAFAGALIDAQGGDDRRRLADAVPFLPVRGEHLF
jgi:hypothetical protein